MKGRGAGSGEKGGNLLWKNKNKSGMEQTFSGTNLGGQAPDCSCLFPELAQVPLCNPTVRVKAVIIAGTPLQRCGICKAPLPPRIRCSLANDDGGGDATVYYPIPERSSFLLQGEYSDTHGSFLEGE